MATNWQGKDSNRNGAIWSQSFLTLAIVLIYAYISSERLGGKTPEYCRCLISRW